MRIADAIISYAFNFQFYPRSTSFSFDFIALRYSLLSILSKINTGTQGISCREEASLSILSKINRDSKTSPKSRARFKLSILSKINLISTGQTQVPGMNSFNSIQDQPRATAFRMSFAIPPLSILSKINSTCTR